MSEKHLIWQYGAIRCADRERLNGYYFVVVWFTGLSGAGKSTLAHAVEQALYEQHILCLELDGDNIRHGLCSDLGFSPNHRRENLRRVSEVAKLAREASMVTLGAFISPIQADCEMVREIIGDEYLIEVYVRCSLAICEARDVKGIYRKARAGEVQEFTGVSAPYEAPESADIILDTDRDSKQPA